MYINNISYDYYYMFQCIETCSFNALKHVGVLTKYKILLVNICCAFVGLNKERSSLFMFG
jgi:hypothetical protein